METAAGSISHLSHVRVAILVECAQYEKMTEYFLRIPSGLSSEREIPKIGLEINNVGMYVRI